MHSKTDEKVYVDPTSEKPKIKARCVIEEADEVKVILGPLIKYITGIKKRICNWYGSGLNFGERAEKFEKWIEKIPGYKVICIDGSAFDSTQHGEIRKGVDSFLLNNIIDNHLEDLSRYCTVSHLRFISNNVCKWITGKTRTCTIKALIDGTVGSGEMNTSDGNTTREALYCMYTAHKAGLKYEEDFFFETCGDDLIMIICETKYQLFIESAYKHTYVKALPDFKLGTEKLKYGLGQVAKMIEVFDDIREAEYISAHFLVNKNGTIKMIRKMNRLFQLTPWTRSVKQVEQSAIQTELNGFLYCDAQEMLTWSGDIELLTKLANKWMSYIPAKSSFNLDRYYNAHKYVNRVDRRLTDMNEAFLEHMEKFYQITKEEIAKFLRTLDKSTRFSKIRSSMIDKVYGKGNTNVVVYKGQEDKSVIQLLNKKRTTVSKDKSVKPIIIKFDKSGKRSIEDLQLLEFEG